MRRPPPPRKGRNGSDRTASHDEPMRTVAEVAPRLACSEVTVRRRIRDGSLPAIKHGRIIRVRESDLVAFIHASHGWRRPKRPKPSSKGQVV